MVLVLGVALAGESCSLPPLQTEKHIQDSAQSPPQTSLLPSLLFCSLEKQKQNFFSIALGKVI